jgi:hypothetical protein
LRSRRARLGGADGGIARQPLGRIQLALELLVLDARGDNLRHSGRRQAQPPPRSLLRPCAHAPACRA